MPLELMQFLASHRKNYPGGVPSINSGQAVPMSAASVTSAPQVIFFSDTEFSPEEVELVRNAAEKGLKLTSAQYLLTTDSSVLVQRSAKAQCVVVLGKSSKVKHNSSRVIYTYSPSEILGSSEIKRGFWDEIKVLAAKN